MKDVTYITIEKDRVIKKFNYKHVYGPLHFRKESFFYRKLEKKEICPPIINIKENEIHIAKGIDFSKFTKSPSLDKNKLKEQILEKIDIMKSLRVAHRDLHSKNIILINKEPYFIDFELSAFCNSELPSYDLYGPEESLVEPPSIHSHLNIKVYWNSDDSKSPALGKFFGKV